MKNNARMLLIFGVVAAVVCVILLRPAGARNAVTRITLDEAIALAKKNNHDYKLARTRQKADSEKVNQAWGTLLPVIESQAALVRQGAKAVAKICSW